MDMPIDRRLSASREPDPEVSPSERGSVAVDRAPEALPDEVDRTPATADVDRLFREHNEALLRFVAAKLGSTHEAKDIAQEAYVRLLGLTHREAVSYLRAFLYKTAGNLATDRLRERARRAGLMSSVNVDLVSFEISPERQLDGELALERLREGIAELPEKCRQAFLLYRLDGLCGSEIAARLGLQERMVWLYIARALEYLRSRVDGSAPRKGTP